MKRLARIERELGPVCLLILWVLLTLAFIDLAACLGWL